MSTNASSRATPAGRVPQRERGKRRVAALLEAAAAVFAEKGYGAATMTEVAARAGAPIGSLYQFFPAKEALADALLQRYADHLRAALAPIEADAATRTPAALADALIDARLGLRDERRAAVELLDAHRDADTGVLRQIHGELRRCLVRIVKARLPALTAARRERIAVVLQYQMKTAAAICEGEGGPRSAALAEWRAMVRDYVARLGDVA
ncbi:MAG: helix-turn-helix domain-containing protein [Solimonas sp.]